jgi:hypothetical protein
MRQVACHQLEDDMENILKKDFCLLLAIKPHSVIGKEIAMKDGNFVKILDVALGGSYMFIRGYDPEPSWVGTDILDEQFIIDSSPTKNAEIIGIKKLDDMYEKISKFYRGGKR